MSDANPPSQSAPQNKLPVRIRLNNWQIVLIALIIVGGRLVLDFSRRIIEGQQKVTEQLRLELEIEALLAEQRQLEAEKLYYSSDIFVEDWAHSEGKMVRAGEVLVIPVTDGNAAITEEAYQPDIRSPETPLSPWKIWWFIFFDSPPPVFRQQ